MPFWLAEHVVCAPTYGGAVFLDLRLNRYRGLSLRASALLPHILQDWTPASTSAGGERAIDDLSRSLLDSGLITTRQPLGTRFQARADLLANLVTVSAETADAKLTWAMTRSFGRSLRWAHTAVNSRTLYATARDIEERKRVLACDTISACRQAVALTSAFERLRPLAYRSQHRCLLHALALTHFLLEHRVPATWVIGARTLPWAAHSWVQCGDMLLAATPEQVCEYAPLLAA